MNNYPYTVVVGHQLFLALALGFGELAQRRRRPHEELIPDLAVLPTERQVIRNVSAVRHAVHVGTQCD